MSDDETNTINIDGEEISEAEALAKLEEIFVKDIILYPSAVLREVCEPIKAEEFGSAELAKVIKCLQATMVYSGGVGLAANQIAVNRRVCVLTDETFRDPINSRVFLNPEVIFASTEEMCIQEGCLSLPGIEATVCRPRKIKVRYFDFFGKVIVQEFEGLDAFCLQHEIDHLDGKIFVDRLSEFGQKRLLDKYKKKSRHEEKYGVPIVTS